MPVTPRVIHRVLHAISQPMFSNSLVLWFIIGSHYCRGGTFCQPTNQPTNQPLLLVGGLAESPVTKQNKTKQNNNHGPRRRSVSNLGYPGYSECGGNQNRVPPVGFGVSSRQESHRRGDAAVCQGGRRVSNLIGQRTSQSI